MASSVSADFQMSTSMMLLRKASPNFDRTHFGVSESASPDEYAISQFPNSRSAATA
jgi:hypothetical protein